MSKLSFYLTKLKEWFKHPSASFCPSKSFKVSFKKKYTYFDREEYIIEFAEDGNATSIPASINCKNSISEQYADLMKVFIEYYNTNLTNAAASVACI